MINYINENKAKHIITLEDPIEYVHHHKKSIINQREVGTDTASFANGLRASLKAGPGYYFSRRDARFGNDFDGNYRGGNGTLGIRNITYIKCPDNDRPYY